MADPSDLKRAITDKYSAVKNPLHLSGMEPKHFDLRAAIALCRHYLGRSIHGAVSGRLSANPASGMVVDLNNDYRFAAANPYVKDSWLRNEASNFEMPNLPSGTRRSGFPRRVGYRVNNVRASVRSGMAWDPSVPLILLESYGSLTQAMTWGRALGETNRSSRNRRLHRTSFIVPCVGFFHLLVEILPALLASIAHVDGEIDLIYEKKAPKYIENWVRMIADAYPNKLTVYPQTGVFDFDDLIVPGYSNSGDFSPKDSALISSFAARVSADTFTGEPNSRIYLSRFGERRSPPYEAELEDRMRNLGFTIFRDFARLSPAQQIGVLRSSSVLAGVHGAALALAMFMEKGSLVVEIVRSDRRLDAFARIASACSSEHMSVDFDSAADWATFETAVKEQCR